MDLFDRELDIGDDRFATPRTHHSASKSFRSKRSETPRSNNSDDYKSVSSQNDNGDYKSVRSNRYDHEMASNASFHSAMSGGGVNDASSRKQYADFPRPPRKESNYVSDTTSEQSYNDNDVSDIFSYARHGRCDDILRSFGRGVPVDIRDEVGNTMLIVACQNGNKRVIKTVLRNGANINIKNYKGNTPLHYCYHCELIIVRLSVSLSICYEWILLFIAFMSNYTIYFCLCSNCCFNCSWLWWDAGRVPHQQRRRLVAEE